MSSSPANQNSSGWGFQPQFAVCPRCSWRYLLSSGSAGVCPNCFQADLDQLSAENLPQDTPPELLVPHSLPRDRMASQVQGFASGIPFAPADLTPSNLAGRLQRVFLPVWLVDVSVQAGWQLEAGFNYQVVSHQERYKDGAGGWRTQEVKETRVRWEPRLGRLERSYANLVAPALEEHARLRDRLGDFDVSAAHPYQTEQMGKAYVRLPDRSQDDAWPDVVPGLQSAAAVECGQAAGADHVRDFRWTPEISSRSWTLMLLPVYSTYYLDDERQPQPVYINGQSGRVSGVRRASLKRAQRTAWIILAVALCLFLASILIGTVGLFLFGAGAGLVPLAGIGIVAAVVVALGALIPLGMAWGFNRRG